MLLRCVATLPTLPQSISLGRYYEAGTREFPVEPGHTYVAFGLRVWGTGVWVDIETVGGYLVLVPLYLFEIADARVSSLWRIRVDENQGVALLPESFHAEYFHDDLIEGVLEARAAFSAVKQQMLAEHAVSGEPKDQG